MKKILALVLALAMALSLGSCALAEDVSLRVWVGDNQDIDWINKVIENFKAAHPENNYTIEVGVQTEGDCSKVVLTDPTAAADVFAFADDQLNELVAAGALQEVTLNADDVKSRNLEGSVEAASLDGKLYAYPMTADNGYFLYYDSSVISAEDAQTVDGILAAAAAAGRTFDMKIGRASCRERV